MNKSVTSRVIAKSEQNISNCIPCFNGIKIKLFINVGGLSPKNNSPIYFIINSLNYLGFYKCSIYHFI